MSILILLVMVGSSRAAARAQTPKAGPAVKFLNTEPGVQYVGSEACSRCHSDIYTRYLATKMGRSVTGARDPRFLKLVPKPVTIYNRDMDRYFQVFAEGKNIYQTEYQLSSNGREIFRTTQQLAYAIGAGMDGYTFVVQKGDYLFEAPLSYYSHARSWELSPGYQSVDFGFNRPVGRDCIVCHSGRPQPVKDREGRFENPPFLEMAVGCENCHGPGELHVKQRLVAAPLEGFFDATIVNPSHLSGWLADNICLNCHQSGDARVDQTSGSSSRFRPGLVLDDSVATFALPLARQSPPNSPLLQHYFLMIMSKCYRSSGGRLSCITCHDPHIEPAREVAPAYFRKKCLTCHTDRSCSIPRAARLKKSPADNCAGCHMPKQNLPLISHSSLTNHRIIARDEEPFPEEAFHLASGPEPGLVHISAIPGKGKVPVPPLVQLEAYGQLVDSHPEYRAPFDALLDQISKTEPDNIAVQQQLAHRDMLEKTPQSLEEAATHLRKAIELGSTAADNYETLAQLLSRSGGDAEAMNMLRQALEIDPYRARIYQNLTLLCVKTHHYAEALSVMKKELEVFPQDSTMRELIRQAEGGVPGP
ncbi:MAG TPA: hypothetical protein VGW37_17105 [Terriglobia bacterium]|nr:hypothetical protein [Terriglobia bacterium]